MRSVCASTMTMLSEDTACTPESLSTFCGRGKSRFGLIWTSPKFTENSSHHIENHLISLKVFPSGSVRVISLLRYFFNTPLLPRSSRIRKPPIFDGALVFPT